MNACFLRPGPPSAKPKPALPSFLFSVSCPFHFTANITIHKHVINICVHFCSVSPHIPREQKHTCSAHCYSAPNAVQDILGTQTFDAWIHECTDLTNNHPFPLLLKVSCKKFFKLKWVMTFPWQAVSYFTFIRKTTDSRAPQQTLAVMWTWSRTHQ